MVMVNSMKEYRVKVTEKHSDYVWVKAESKEEAEEMAIDESLCEFECVYDSEVVEENEL